MREVGSQLGASLHLGQTYSAVLERAAALFGADACAVYELQADGRTLCIRSAVGLSSEYVLRSKVRLGAGVVGRAVAQAAPVAVRDLAQDPQGGGSRYTRQLLAAGRYPYRGVLGLPLSVRGRVVGGLALYFYANLPLTQDDLSLASVFAAQAALSIENARLYEEEVRRERESAALLNVAKLQGQDHEAPDLTQTVKLAVGAPERRARPAAAVRRSGGSEYAGHRDARAGDPSAERHARRVAGAARPAGTRPAPPDPSPRAAGGGLGADRAGPQRPGRAGPAVRRPPRRGGPQ